MKHFTRALLAHLLVLIGVASSHAKAVRLPAFDIVEAVQKARQFAEQQKLDVARLFVLSAEYKNGHDEYEEGYWVVTWALTPGAMEPRIILRVAQDGTVKMSEAEQPRRLRGTDVAGFLPDPVANHPEIGFTEKDLKDILDTWHVVSPERWLTRSSHMTLNDRIGTFVVAKDKTIVRWLVRAGGLAQLTFPDGSKIHFAKTLPDE